MATYRNFRHLQPAEDYAVFMDDFFGYVAADWTVTEVGLATQALTPGNGGLLLITNAAADNDSSFQQLVTETFRFVTGKKLSFKARLKVSDATQSDFVIGLQITDTTPLAVSDGVFIRKDDGDALLDFVVAKNATESVLTGFASAVNDTYFVVEFYYDGSSSDIDVSFDGVRAGSLPLTNLPDDEDLTISFGIQNGEAVAKTMTVDYILVQSQR